MSQPSANPLSKDVQRFITPSHDSHLECLVGLKCNVFACESPVVSIELGLALARRPVSLKPPVSFNQLERPKEEEEKKNSLSIM